MAYWLLKTEPGSYGWADLVRDGATEWDGVRNPVAAANLRRMAVGDKLFIYHSGKEKAAVGIAAVTRAARPDGGEGTGFARIAPVAPLARPVTLAAMKAEPMLAGMPMLRQPRLSVSPISDAEWAILTRMAEG